MKRIYTCLLLLFVVYGCREEYYPPVKELQQQLLVVEGVINSDGITTVRLTKTFKLADTARLSPEAGAQVQIEGKNGNIFPLVYTNNGYYKSSPLSLPIGQEYRLYIKTAGGKAYASDYVAVRNNPDIDKIEWDIEDDRMQISVSTHNPNNNTRYYRWEYEETWEIRSAYFSAFKMQGDLVVPRQPADSAYVCWKYWNATEILLASSAKLQADVINKKPIIFIPKNSEKLSHRYSILVRQYALDESAYVFYEQMKKNTESIGSIFDAQPTEIRGNIHSLSQPDELVIGFITACPIKEKRVFIDRDHVPGWRFVMDCTYNMDVSPHPDSIKRYFSSGELWPYSRGTIGYMGAKPECTDCTLRGGSNKRPSYW